MRYVWNARMGYIGILSHWMVRTHDFIWNINNEISNRKQELWQANNDIVSTVSIWNHSQLYAVRMCKTTCYMDMGLLIERWSAKLLVCVWFVYISWINGFWFFSIMDTDVPKDRIPDTYMVALIWLIKALDLIVNLFLFTNMTPLGS